MNIKQHFEAAEASRQSEIETLQKDISANREQRKSAEKEQKKKESLLADLEKENVSTAELKEKLDQLVKQVVVLDLEFEKYQKKCVTLSEAENVSFERHQKMSRILELHKCVEADEFETSEGYFASLLTRITLLDAVGRPLQCEIVLDSEHRREIPINLGKTHFFRDFRPPTLEWLPLVNSGKPNERRLNRNHDNQVNIEWEWDDSQPIVRAFWHSKEKKIVLSTTKLSWREKRPKRNSYGYSQEEEWHSVSDDFSDIALTFEGLLDQVLEPEKGALDLDKEYAAGTLLAHLQKVLKAELTEEPMFKSCEGPAQICEEIYQHIKLDWEAFKMCPWSKDIRGSLALLKYHAENGERIRLWSLEFKGQYGFRMRTRDHDWIIGEIYVQENGSPAASKEALRIHEPTHSAWIGQLGRMFLHVQNPPSRD